MHITASYSQIAGSLQFKTIAAFQKVFNNETLHYDTAKKQNISFADYCNEHSISDTDIRLAVADIDRDGVPEVLLEHSPGIIRVLRFENGVIYGFSFGFRAMSNLKKDGSFDWSNSAFESGRGRQTFSGSKTERVILAEEKSEAEEVEWYPFSAESAMMFLSVLSGNTPDGVEYSVFGNMKLSGTLPNGQMQLLFDELLQISGEDTETLKKYGYNPDEGYDYIIHNVVEEWVMISTLPETKYEIVVYDKEFGSPTGNKEVDKENFLNYLRGEEYPRQIFADIIFESGKVYSVKEKYIP
jgi:hypothetical protein